MELFCKGENVFDVFFFLVFLDLFLDLEVFGYFEEFVVDIVQVFVFDDCIFRFFDEEMLEEDDSVLERD